MPTLDFKGKQFIYAHHLSVPFRTLEVDAKKSLPPKGKKPSLDDNLIIHGDNLHALKALLPTHAGKIDCIYIDPPYNTGNEGWRYNDAVNSPLMKAWLKQNSPVDREDLERHDKWCCMMWPRLQLLKDLLAEDGTIFISIDDNEIHRLRSLMDEVFGEENFAAQVTLLCNPKGRGLSDGFADTHEYVLVYVRRDSTGDFAAAKSQDRIEQEYPLEDEDGKYREIELRNTHREFGRHNRKNLWYPIYVNPKNASLSVEEREGNIAVWPVWPDGYEGCWTWQPSKVRKELSELVARNVSGTWRIFRKARAANARRKATTVWLDVEYQSEKGQAVFEAVMGKRFSHPPKSMDLIAYVLEISSDENSIILDSFAGSGTTAHAVLKMNQKDGGNRRFILVECEDYADTLTAERVRRVIQGYKFQGTKREELHSENVTWTRLKRAGELLELAESIENLEGHRFDRIGKTVKDGVFQVIGEKKVEEKTEGLGGSFTYCELGEEINIETLLKGERLPDYAALARYVFYTATGRTLEKVAKPRGDWFIGETEAYRVHLLYKPDGEWMRSNEAALDAKQVEQIAKSTPEGKRALVFAAAKFMSQKDLTERRIAFCQLPYAIHRVMGG